MPSRKIPITMLAIAALALSMGGAACHRKRTPQAPSPLVIVPSESQPAAPTTPPENTANPAKSKPPETPPATAPGLVVPPAKKSSPRSAPRTTPAETPATPAETTPPKPASPRMSPRLSRAELAELEKKTSAAINAAEKNMQTAYGKQLNAEQNDMLEKIRGFLGQAREAVRAGDWQRAYNLAEKARVLSVELVNSL